MPGVFDDGTYGHRHASLGPEPTHKTQFPSLVRQKIHERADLSRRPWTAREHGMQLGRLERIGVYRLRGSGNDPPVAGTPG
jgi:hypothetical protein